MEKSSISIAMIVVGYFASWSIYQRNFHISQIPPQRYSHIIYAFIGISEDNSVELIDGKADIGSESGNWQEENEKGNLNELKEFKRKNSSIKTGISIGGQSQSQRFASMMSSPESRMKFIESVMAFLDKFELDFVDVDWEFPQNAQDAQNLLLFVKEFHAKAIGKKFITLAIPTTDYHLRHFLVKEMQEFVEFFNVMCYCYGEYWRKTVEFNAPLYADGICIDETFKYFLEERKLSASKLVMGNPAYCVSFRECYEMHQEHRGPASFSSKSGFLDFKELLALQRSNHQASKTVLDVKRATAYTILTVSQEQPVLITHETWETVNEKREYCLKNGLKGLMMWHIGADSLEDSLLKGKQERIQTEEKSMNDASEEKCIQSEDEKCIQNEDEIRTNNVIEEKIIKDVIEELITFIQTEDEKSMIIQTDENSTAQIQEITSTSTAQAQITVANTEIPQPFPIADSQETSNGKKDENDQK